MIDLEIFKELDPVEVSDEKMQYYKKELLIMHDELIDKFGDDVKKLDTEDFDPYSFFGEKKLKKLAKAHAKKVAEVDMLIGVIDDEMKKRENYNEEQRYVDNGNYVPKYSLDPDEYLKTEQEKTEKIRKGIEDFDD